jgi:hypothetical protein
MPSPTVLSNIRHLALTINNLRVGTIPLQIRKCSEIKREFEIGSLSLLDGYAAETPAVGLFKSFSAISK